MYLQRELKSCSIIQTIGNEDYVLDSDVDDTIEEFIIRKMKKVQFLPVNISDKFPNLKLLEVNDCGLTVVRSFYFKNMFNVQRMDLNHNEIDTIEVDAFKDLVSVERLFLEYNSILTLDEKLFVSMVSLETLMLRSNYIDFLTTSTFKIPGGKLYQVDLRANELVLKDIDSDNGDLETTWSCYGTETSVFKYKILGF